ncbi:MAG: hypothetical protein L3K15_07140 [Thermoplasmata archaeon]|nr:hypothetical protein [Thermoplasmata archaeon]
MKAAMVRTIGRTAVAIFLVAMVVGEALLLLPAVAPSLSFHANLTKRGPASAQLNFTMVAPFAADVQQAWFLHNQTPSAAGFEFYYDPAYPSSNTDPNDWLRLAARLQTVEQAHGSPVAVALVDGVGLARFLTNPSPSARTLVLASGVLPDTVFDRSHDLLGPWLRGGGQLIWVGDPIGALVGHRGPATRPGNPEYIGSVGTARFLPPGLLGGTGFTYSNFSGIGLALGGRYPYGWPGDDLRESRLAAVNGTALGGSCAGFNNIARLMIGNGSVLYVGSPLRVANLLGNVLLDRVDTGVAFHDSPLLESGGWTLIPGTRFTRSETVVDPFPVGTPPPSLCVYTFQVDYLATFADLQCMVLG